MDKVIAALEDHIRDARAQVNHDPAQAAYWRGVLFGLELALLEAQKSHAAQSNAAAPASEIAETMSRLHL